MTPGPGHQPGGRTRAGQSSQAGQPQRTAEGLWGKAGASCRSHPHPSPCRVLSAHVSWPLACKLEKGCLRLSSAAFRNEKVYFKQYSTTSPSCLRGGGSGLACSRGLPRQCKRPQPWAVPGRGQAGRIVMTPCTCPSLPWKPLELTRRADGPPLPELDEQPLVSDSNDRETKCLCPPPPQASASLWLHGQALLLGRPTRAWPRAYATSGSLTSWI